LSVFVGNLLIRNGKWSEPLVLAYDNLNVIHLVTFWLRWFEDVKVEAPYKIDELPNRGELDPFSRTREGTYGYT
jgi:hypothetical protein